MPTYLLDTSTASALMQRHPTARNRIASLDRTDRIVVCTIVVGEIRYGLERLPQGRRRRDLEARATSLLSGIPCEAIPEAAAEHYALCKSHLARRGTPLDENDLWIAATALALGATLVTADNHFRRVSGLKLEDWSG